MQCVVDAIRKRGYDGLCGCGCGCGVDGLNPCGYIGCDCELAYAAHCGSCKRQGDYGDDRCMANRIGFDPKEYDTFYCGRRCDGFEPKPDRSGAGDDL